MITKEKLDEMEAEHRKMMLPDEPHFTEIANEQLEIIALARLGLWARKEAIPALKSIAADNICFNDPAPFSGSYIADPDDDTLEARDALTALPKYTQ